MSAHRTCFFSDKVKNEKKEKMNFKGKKINKGKERNQVGGGAKIL